LLLSMGIIKVNWLAEQTNNFPMALLDGKNTL